MTGELFPLDGMVRRHNHLRVAQFHQHLTEKLDMEMPALHYMIKEYPGNEEEKMRGSIGKFGLTGNPICFSLMSQLHLPLPESFLLFRLWLSFQAQQLPPHHTSFTPSSGLSLPSSSYNPLKLPLFWPWQKVKVGPLSVSPIGFGTWAWGNQLLWGYQEAMDDELQRTFNLAVDNGINLFDIADSYGTGRLNGQSEKLLGKFIREFQGLQDDIVIATKFAAYPWRLTPGQFVNACRGSLERIQVEQIGIGQLHWSNANYAPLQEMALWDGLVAMYEKEGRKMVAMAMAGKEGRWCRWLGWKGMVVGGGWEGFRFRVLMVGGGWEPSL
ncbi:hypothetical protein G4B88_014701 [Cannabis sativa]|uniref:NADP-dependent oxidoreductase domain-containing protein n=1 Tax=Cannabis sativa TaxID=3483 RepID=A0A7J6IAP1_CANSA|nr:hypothetical protein G4B88_014701 [Cannabis sativa]